MTAESAAAIHLWLIEDSQVSYKKCDNNCMAIFMVMYMLWGKLQYIRDNKLYYMYYIVMYYTKSHIIALCCITLYYIMAHYITLYESTLHYIK